MIVLRQARDQKKIFAKHINDKGLVSKIYKGLLKLNKKKTTQLKNGGKDLNRHFSGEDIQRFSKCMKRWSTLLMVLSGKFYVILPHMKNGQKI